MAEEPSAGFEKEAQGEPSDGPERVFRMRREEATTRETVRERRERGRKRQRVRRLALLVSFLLFPITIFYFSPVLIIEGFGRAPGMVRLGVCGGRAARI